MMETTMEQPLIADPSNAHQVQAWDGSEGAFWTARAGRFDETLASCHGPFLTAAAIGEGEHVLDVGCGTGQATRDAARIARRSSALGVDLSSQMVALAGRTAASEGLENVEFQHADAQIHRFEPGAFDVVISRMGSMFFGDPITAFSNLHRALLPGGRLTLLTWQSAVDNEWLTEFHAALAVGRDLPTPPSDVPSPFASERPRSGERHPRVGRLRRHRPPGPSRADELRGPTPTTRSTSSATSRAGCSTASTQPDERPGSPHCAPRSPRMPTSTLSHTNLRPGSSKRTDPDPLDVVVGRRRGSEVDGLRARVPG